MKPTIFISILVLISFSAVSQEQVFFGNLHSHTSLSDGSGLPAEAYEHARDVAGLDFLAITEHNHKSAPSQIQDNPDLYSGSAATSLISIANQFNEDGVFVALYGQEFSSIGSGNHANIFEIDTVISTSIVENGRWDSLFNIWLPAHPDSQGEPPLLLLNHPAQSSSPNSKEYGIDDLPSDEWHDKLDSHAQLINIINGPSHEGSHLGKPSQGEFLRYLNMGFHLGPTADQDNHLKNWGSAADTRTGVIANELTKPAILEALKNRHVYATEDKNLRLILKINGELMGTIIQGNDVPDIGEELEIQLSIKDDDEPNAIYTIDVFTDVIGGTEKADVIAEFEIVGDGTFDLDGVTYQGGNQYYFIKLTQTDDDHEIKDRAWIAPIWFEPMATSGTPADVMVTLEVNRRTEEAKITNVGSAAIDLIGWRLLSVRGNQHFDFTTSLVLESGESVVVTSGPNTRHQPPDFVSWTDSFIWNNERDDGKLINLDLKVVAEAP